MNKKIIVILTTWLTLLVAIPQANAQMITKELITGKWKLNGVIAEGELMPFDSDATFIQYMLDDKLAKKKQKEGPHVTLTSKDSISTLGSAKILLPMRQSEAEFKSNGKFRFTLQLGLGQKMEKTGTWQLDEAAQNILITEKADNKNALPGKLKATIKNNQLFLQLEEASEDGYYLRKKE